MPDFSMSTSMIIQGTSHSPAIFAARSYGIKTIVLTGNLTTIKPVREVFDSLESHFGIRFLVPEQAQFGTVIGAALSRVEEGSEIR